VVFLTDLMDIRGSVLAMKSGAMDVLAKPIEQDELLSAIRGAMAQDLAARRARALRDERSQHFALLTPREREVCGWVSAGLRNKQIAVWALRRRRSRPTAVRRCES
jgi:FixJ family two-component response regulator